MNKLKLLIFLSLVLVVAALTWGIDQGWAQTDKNNQQQMTNYEKFQEELAARRAARGQMKSTTPSQRKAAAQRLKATLNPQGEQGAPTSGGEVNQ